MSHLGHDGAGRLKYALRSVALRGRAYLMVALRIRPKGGLLAPFGLGVFLACAVAPSVIGNQDLTSLIARQPAVAERQGHGIASPFGTIHATNYNMPRPVSTAMPTSLSYALAGLDAHYADITGSIRERLLGEREMLGPTRLPTVERRRKGDRLVPGMPPPPGPTLAVRPSDHTPKKGDRLDGGGATAPAELADVPAVARPAIAAGLDAMRGAADVIAGGPAAGAGAARAGGRRPRLSRAPRAARGRDGRVARRGRSGATSDAALLRRRSDGPVACRAAALGRARGPQARNDPGRGRLQPPH